MRWIKLTDEAGDIYLDADKVLLVRPGTDKSRSQISMWTGAEAAALVTVIASLPDVLRLLCCGGTE